MKQRNLPWWSFLLQAALILQIDNADTRIWDWAIEHTPFDGSNEQAERLSKDLRDISAEFFYPNILAAPSGKEPLSWYTAKAKGTAAYVNKKLVYALKKCHR